MSLEPPSSVKPGLATWQLIRDGIPVSLVTGSKPFPLAYQECHNSRSCLGRNLRKHLLILVVQYWTCFSRCGLGTPGVPKALSVAHEVKIIFIVTLMQYLPFVHSHSLSIQWSFPEAEWCVLTSLLTNEMCVFVFLGFLEFLRYKYRSFQWWTQFSVLLLCPY